MSEKPRLKGSHVALLVALYEYGTLTFGDVRRVVRADYEYCNLVVEELKMQGYITEERIGMKRRIRVFRLTEEGRKIAKKFYEILR